MGGTGRHLRAGGSRRRVLVAALIAVAAALGPGAAAASAVTDVVMFSDPGDFIGLGHSQLFTAANAAITAHTQAFAIVDVEVNGGPLGDTFSLEFAAPPGQPFVPGVYENAQRASFRTAGHPGIDVFGDGRGCSGDDGRFEVRDVAIAPDGTVSRPWLGYEQHCEGSAPALYGEVRIGEPAPPRPRLPPPAPPRPALSGRGGRGGPGAARPGLPRPVRRALAADRPRGAHDGPPGHLRRDGARPDHGRVGRRAAGRRLPDPARRVHRRGAAAGATC